MTDEIQAVDESYSDFYKSLVPARRETDEELLHLVIANGVIPSVLRYGAMNSVIRGVVKSTSGELFYFQHVQDRPFHLVAANTANKQWEAEKLLKNCKLGCDLKKSEPSSGDDDTEEREDEERKAAPNPAPPAAFSEEQAIAGQQRQITEQHPGGAGAITPDLPDVGRDWHAAEKALPDVQSQAAQIENPLWRTTDLLRAWGAQLQATAPRVNQVSPQERRFLIEVLGRTPQEVDTGRAFISPSQKVQYQIWLQRGLRTTVSSLQEWVEKSKK
jgi:hypothetical protein